MTRAGSASTNARASTGAEMLKARRVVSPDKTTRAALTSGRDDACCASAGASEIPVNASTQNSPASTPNSDARFARKTILGDFPGGKSDMQARFRGVGARFALVIN